MKIKKGDKVIVLSGKDRGKTGNVVRAFPKKDMVIVDGVHILKKHQRATRASGKGQIIEKSLPIHVSNVQIVDPKSGKGTRVRVDRSKGYARVAVKSGSKLN